MRTWIKQLLCWHQYTFWQTKDTCRFKCLKCEHTYETDMGFMPK